MNLYSSQREICLGQRFINKNVSVSPQEQAPSTQLTYPSNKYSLPDTYKKLTISKAVFFLFFGCSTFHSSPTVTCHNFVYSEITFPASGNALWIRPVVQPVSHNLSSRCSTPVLPILYKLRAQSLPCSNSNR